MKQPKMKRAENLKEMLKVFTPEPLEDENLQEFYYKDTMKNRMGSPVKSPIKRLFSSCTSISNRNAHLFLGHKGCGKSTELNNLKQEFEEAGHPVHMVHANMERDLHRINHWDLMLLITEGLSQIAYDNDIPIPSAILENIYDILVREIKVTETTSASDTKEFKAGGKIKIPLYFIKTFASLGGSLKAGSEMRVVVTNTMDRRARDWQIYMIEISDCIREKLNGKQPIIIFEDLDMLPYPEKIFELLSYSVLSQMPFPIIYTFPISQCYSPKYPAIRASYTAHTLPMIKVADLKDRSEDTEGIKALRDIVEKRADLSLFCEAKDALNLLIRKTGGSLRHLFDSINYAAQLADWRGATKIEHEDAIDALSELRKELTRIVIKPMFDDLANIYNDADIRRQIDDKDFLLNMTHALVVLEYENGDRWHDLHPLIADYLDTINVIKIKELQTDEK